MSKIQIYMKDKYCKYIFYYTKDTFGVGKNLNERNTFIHFHRIISKFTI